ncbi:N-formylglutamate amidohydrolase [Novosphingobium sp. 1949]|uniref:N-formylglutamate amidohydrolase n=1 Tax=Novosphingobium organovorum TaxID=2930092 RepID=A0ABT0BAJ2_9SPHN|nr:N-formylglutamate amidohydrolase [Novosphingobium organovorum]MCJ2182033.1 N-formylglutamate amidohydrolase [Novosphingobium organovorum]
MQTLIETESYRLVGTPRFGGILVVADHASNRVPDGLGLGIAPERMEEHIALDIGVAGIAERMAEREGTAAFLCNVSRLVCDTNRTAGEPAVIPEVSDGYPIPGNQGIDRAARLDRFYHPYHARLTALLDEAPPQLIFVLHSFTPQMASKPDEQRPWHCGVLYDADDRGARLGTRLLEEEGFVVGDQEPYSGKIYKATIERYLESEARPYFYLEVRQDLIATAQGQEEWAERLTRICNRIALEIA